MTDSISPSQSFRFGDHLQGAIIPEKCYRAVPTLQEEMSLHQKLRSACDACHEAKVRCSGGRPCQNCHHHKRVCHYSYTARIGKPKGSRNRKTLARMRLAGLSLKGSHSPESRKGPVPELPPQTATSTTPEPEAGPGSVLFANSFDVTQPLTGPEWMFYGNLSQQSIQQAEYMLYDPGWLQPSLLPSANLGFCLDDMHVVPSPVSSSASQIDGQGLWSQSFNAESMPNMPSLYNTMPSVSTTPFTEDNMRGNPRCYCLEWQTSKVIALHTFTSSTRPVQKDSVDTYLQCISSTLLACQKTLECQSCDKDSTLTLFIIASVQMTVRQLETLPWICEALPVVKIMLLHHAFSHAQDVLHSLRAVIKAPSKALPITDISFSPLNFLGGATDSSYLQSVIDRLQAELEILHSTFMNLT